MQDCFLAKEEWRNLWADGRDPFSALVDEFWDCFALCPHAVRRAHELRNRSEGGVSLDLEATLAVTKEAEDLHNRLIAWHDIVVQYLPAPQEVATTNPEPPYPTVLTYPSVWLGTLYMGYWASLLIVQSAMESCGYPVDTLQSTQKLLANILKSVECVGEGLMGPYRIGYSLRIAAEFAGPGERAWISRVLRPTASSFAATTPTEVPGRLRRLLVGADN
ncbi:hypothetical protein IMZ48_14835 [Candidatus Bathyarchaeota archaeon]|nr:hypothetical protein [Candidatus Bathyarchaeota archaeon]